MDQQNQPSAQQPIIINNSTPERKQTNHLLHFILTLVTVGLWLPVWIIVAIVNN
jgi:hypothetical protein